MHGLQKYRYSSNLWGHISWFCSDLVPQSRTEVVFAEEPTRCSCFLLLAQLATVVPFTNLASGLQELKESHPDPVFPLLFSPTRVKFQSFNI